VSALAPGTPAPAFRLMREDGEGFTEGDLQGEKTMPVFYPFAFPDVNRDIPAHA
jgi:peroxiredoxin